MATSGNTIAGINVALGLQSAAFLRGIEKATAETAKASQRMQRDLNQMNRSFEQTGRAVTQFANGFKSLFALQQIFQAAKAVADYSDSWQQAGNKIAAAEQISGRSARSLSDINTIAIETRSSLDATADLYAKLLRTTADVAKSEEEVAKATRIVSQGFKAGGASTLEMENGIRQLAQALGSGILQGDELRSIRENAPLIAAALAKEFNTTVGGLKKLGAEGKITSDRIFKAVLASETEIEQAFGRTNSTIGESFTNLGNSVTQYIGQAGKHSGASMLITDGVNAIAEAIRNMGKNPGSATNVIGKFLAPAIQFTKEQLEEITKLKTPEVFRELGTGATETAREFFDFSAYVDQTKINLDRVDTSLNKVTQSGNTLAASDLFKMGDFASKFKTFGEFAPWADPEKNKSLNKEVQAQTKAVQSAHKDMIASVGTLEEQFAQKLKGVADKYKMPADAARITADIMLDQQEAMLNSIEGFGGIVAPFERAEIARKRVTQAFDEGAERDRALAGVDLKLAQANDAVANAMGRVLSPAEELANKMRDINAAKAAGIEVGNAAEQSQLRSLDQAAALRDGLGLAITPMEAVDALNRKIAESTGLVASAQELAALKTKTRIDAENALTTSVGMQLDPFQQFAAKMAEIDIQKAHGIDVTQKEIAAYSALGGTVLDLAGQAAGAFGSMFKDNKAFAIANAVISTAEAIAKTIGTFGATPWGLAAAGVAAAVGAAQIATILSTNPGSGGKTPSVKGGGGGKTKGVDSVGKSSSSSSKSKGGGFDQMVTIKIIGDVFGPEHFRKIAAGLNQVSRDGTPLINIQ